MAEQTSTTPAAQERPQYSGKLLQAAVIAKPFQESIQEDIKVRKEHGKKAPKLVGILAKPSPPSIAYAEWTGKACESVGIEFEIWKTWDDSVVPKEGVEDADASLQNYGLEADVEDLILAANRDNTVDGIMVYYPIFGGRQDTYLQQIVDPRKDVEGLNFYYCWNMYHNVRWILPRDLGSAPGTTSEMQLSRNTAIDDGTVPPGYCKSILPCTPLAVVKALESSGVYDASLPYGDRLYGKTITVVNRSEVVGRPLAALLANDGARVFSVDIDSIVEFNKRVEGSENNSTEAGKSERVVRAHKENAAARLRSSHIVRACPYQDPKECISKSDVVIGGVPAASYKIPTEWIKENAVCINFSSEKNFEKDVRSRASAYLPAVGKITVSMLQRNLLRLVEYKEIRQSNE
ncbi:methylenetetrahydrofolate dehydrogenase (NAD(+)) [Malassezia cuniculi]|uniref:Methylenetetrahydrofolate dehydrogenase (NAD(+)) n=1 Tax=Malassezia cuniculi TaxID=948313 RepID=A0AAF0J7K7_9BASI|nr:methylenetetrahydrofolate dehydrogenase (NAD(+)) [Malassezia cuniculi]